MNNNLRTLALALSAAAASATSLHSASAANVFSDNLTATTSTVNLTSTPTGGNTTSYDIASAKNSSANVITNSGLGLTLPISSSAIVQAQAIFTTTPIVLTNVGDNIDLTVTFTDKTSTSIANYFGLYNSGGSAPKTDLANGGLSNTLTTDATGGAQNYLGYVVNLQNNTATKSKIQTRPAQTGSTNTNQDLVSAGASTSQSYAGATQLGVMPAAAPAAPIVAGNTYTEDFLITVTAAASGSAPIQYSLDSNLYSGTTATGTALITIHGTDPSPASVGPPPISSVPFGYNSFDSFAFGYRENSTVAPEFDYTSVTVASNTFSSTPLLGDANGDNKVDAADLNIVLNHLGATSSLRSDGNFDGAPTINLTDLDDVLNNLTATLSPGTQQAILTAEAAFAPVPAPEPCSLALLTIGASCLTIRRRRTG